jgi:hypothetical protein
MRYKITLEIEVPTEAKEYFEEDTYDYLVEAGINDFENVYYTLLT